MEAKKLPKKKPVTTKGDNSKSAQALDNLKSMELFCNYGWKENVVTESYIMRLAQEFYKWAYNLAFVEANPRPYSYTYWCSKAGTSRHVVQKWRDRYPKANDLFKAGIEMLGQVRELGMLEKKFPEKPIMYSQWLYSDEWKEIDEYHDKRKEKTIDSITSLIGSVIDNVDLDAREREPEVSEEEREAEIESKVISMKHGERPRRRVKRIVK